MLTFPKCIASVIGSLIILADICDDVNGKSLYEGDSCNMKDDRVGVCRELPECESIAQALEMRNFPFENLVRCSFIGLIEVICCPDKTPKKSTLLGIFPDELFGSSQTRGPPITARIDPGKSILACKKYSENITGLLDYSTLIKEPTDRGEFPHMAVLGYQSLEEGGSLSWGCSGALISDKYVLTTAHCVYRRENQLALIRLGTNKFDRVTDETMDVGVEHITLHPRYQVPKLYHDIALIRLNITVKFSYTIRPACLYTDPFDLQPNTRAIQTGWGAVSQNSSDHSFLLKFSLTTVELHSCNQTYVDYGLDPRLPNGLHYEQLCAVEQPDSKNDESVLDLYGPLQITTKSGVSTIVGLASCALNCTLSIPQVYARVAFFLEWIESIVWRRS